MSDDFAHITAQLRELRWYWRGLIGLGIIAACGGLAIAAGAFQFFSAKPPFQWLVWAFCAIYALYGAFIGWEVVGSIALAFAAWLRWTNGGNRDSVYVIGGYLVLMYAYHVIVSPIKKQLSELQAQINDLRSRGSA